ncbi:MAG: hypothetical protein JWR69_3036 [Pedosphaera sp.]|nr:hypothetical protein [Pedosphaera sp.]
MSTELLIQCPWCLRTGFTVKGLGAHYCKSNGGNQLPAVAQSQAVNKARKNAASMASDKPWGWDISVTFRDGTNQRFSKSGSATRCKSWGMNKPQAVAVALLESYTRQQWIRAFGDGRMRM